MSLATEATVPLRSRFRTGFTLLEVICVLVLLGVLGSLSLSAFFRGLQAYAESRQWSRDTVQVALALSRLQQELHCLDRVETASKDTLVFVLADDDTAQCGRGFRHADGFFRTSLAYRSAEHTLLLRGTPLLDGVTSFALFLHAGDAVWTPQQPSSQLSFIEIVLTLGGATEHTFRMGICPRSNGNSTGAPRVLSGRRS